MTTACAARTLAVLCVWLVASCTPLGKPIAGDDMPDASGTTDNSLGADPDGGAQAGAGASGRGDANGQNTATAGSGSGTNGSAGRNGSASSGAGGSADTNTGGMSGNPRAGQGGGQGDRGCPAGQLSCDGACLPSDSSNCGACGHDCTTLPNVAGPVTCSGDVCVLSATSCAKGWAHCSEDPMLGCETDVTAPTNCGKCGVQCDASTPMCSSGTCVSGCPAATPTLCGGTCADTTTDTMHCGGCGAPCATTIAHAEPTCASGRCDFKCTDGFMACGNSCVDLNKDAANCGACGKACGGGKMCVSGACQCPASLMRDCDGTCKADSPTSCGSSCELCRSGVARATDTCDNGRCGFKCSSGLSVCSGQCIDTGSDNNNCGICGNSCSAPERCSFGLCVCPTGQHKCGGSCVSNSSINSCGLFSCSPCAAPPGYSATCDGFSCGMTCDGGINCGSTGACADTNKDPRNCGGCGITCLDPASIGPNCVFGSCSP